MVGNDPNWLSEAYEEWQAEIAEGLSDYKLASITGMTRHRCRVLLEYAKTLTEDGEAIDQDSLLFQDDFDYNPSTERYITFVRAAPKGLIVTSKATHDEIVSAYSNWHGKPATLTEMCRRFGFPRSWMVEYLRRHQITHDHEPFSRQDVIERSVEELAEESYQRKRQHLHQESERVKWRRRMASADAWDAFEETVLNRLLDSMADHAPAYIVPELEVDEPPSDYALVVSPTDLHWGLYSAASEVSDPYNRAEARRRLCAHTENIIGRLPGKPTRIVSVLGSDWFNIDGSKPTTTKGTPQDIDGSPVEILESGCMMAVEHIDTLRQVAPVEVVIAPGNHDEHASQMLRLFLMAWYRNAKDVTVSASAKSRAYSVHGRTLMAFHHGQVKPGRIATCMAAEAREDFKRTHYRLAFCGHMHHHSVKEQGGVTHIQLPALVGQSKWEHDQGFADGEPALVCCLVDAEHGLSAWLRSSEAG